MQICDREFYLVIVLNYIPLLSSNFEHFSITSLSISCPSMLPEFFKFAYKDPVYFGKPFVVKLQVTYHQFVGELMEYEETGGMVLAMTPALSHRTQSPYLL